MKTLLIINDNSAEARHAAEFALAMAQKTQADILLMNTSVKAKKIQEKIPAGYVPKTDVLSYHEEHPVSQMLHHLNTLNVGQTTYKPGIENLIFRRWKKQTWLN